MGYGCGVSVLTVARLTMSAVFAIGVVLSAVSDNLLLAIAFVFVAGLGLTAAIRRRPAWRAELIDVRTDRARFRRETLKDLAYYAAFAITAGIVVGVLQEARILPT